MRQDAGSEPRWNTSTVNVMWGTCQRCGALSPLSLPNDCDLRLSGQRSTREWNLKSTCCLQEQPSVFLC